MQFNEIANLFPLMNSAEFEGLCGDIAANGLREAIWTYRDEIIDGRNRFNACRQIGVEPHYREWSGGGSLLSFIVSLNLHRRQLSEAQRAMVAAKLSNLENGQRASPIGEAAVTQPQAAELFNVSSRSISRAKVVLEQGVVDLVEMVEEGQISVSTAATIAAQPKGKQKRLIKRGREKLIEYASNIRVEKQIKKARTTNDVCLICNPGIEQSDETFVAFLHVVARRVSKENARYIYAMIEEMDELNVAGDVRSDYELILEAIDKGYQERAHIHGYTKISREVLDYELKCLIDGGTLEIIQQGGKTVKARGQRKTLYRRRERYTYAQEPLRDDEPE